MTVKEIAIRAVQQLPEDATWGDIRDRLRFVAGVRNDLRELDKGKGMAHEDVRRDLEAEQSR